jgi:predicted Rdx family selenoprotein
MANFFTHFSCLLDVGTPENAARALDLYNKLSEDGASESRRPTASLSIQPEHGGTQLWMRDDETGDPERLIQFVKLRQRVRPHRAVGLSICRHLLAPARQRFRGRRSFSPRHRRDVAWTYTNGWLADVLDGGDPDA